MQAHAVGVRVGSARETARDAAERSVKRDSAVWVVVLLSAKEK